MIYRDRRDGLPVRLKVARILSGLEQVDVARALYDNDRVATISDWERGKHRPKDAPLDGACALYLERGGVSGLWIREGVGPITTIVDEDGEAVIATGLEGHTPPAPRAAKGS